MDAREYLNRKGVGSGERDPDRPNTLEEKAWERARESGSQRPKSGTPHDWEEWERYHGDLAEGAATLDQKIDKDAHRKARDSDWDNASQPQQTVEHYTPPVQSTPSSAQPDSAAFHAASSGHTQPATPEPSGLKVAYMALALLMPPLAVGLTAGGAKRVVICAALTLLAWLPGVVYAVMWLNRR